MPKKKSSAKKKKQKPVIVEELEIDEKKLLKEIDNVDLSGLNADEIEDIEEEITKQVAEVNESKELFDNKNIGTRTELDDDEIVYSTKLKYLANRFNLPIYNELLQNFMEYKLSRKRKSRKEYIDSMKQKVKDMFNNFGGNNDLRR